MTQAAGSLRFSVVVPTRDRAVALEGLLEALAAQQYPAERFEVVLVDDAGSQDLEPTVAPYRDRLRITPLRRSERGGCAGARRRASNRRPANTGVH